MSIVVDGNTFTIIESNESINIEIFDIHKNTYETCITKDYYYNSLICIIMKCLEKEINYSMELTYIDKELIIRFNGLHNTIIFSPKVFNDLQTSEINKLKTKIKSLENELSKYINKKIYIDGIHHYINTDVLDLSTIDFSYFRSKLDFDSTLHKFKSLSHIIINYCWMTYLFHPIKESCDIRNNLKHISIYWTSSRMIYNKFILSNGFARDYYIIGIEYIISILEHCLKFNNENEYLITITKTNIVYFTSNDNHITRTDGCDDERLIGCIIDMLSNFKINFKIYFDGCRFIKHCVSQAITCDSTLKEFMTISKLDKYNIFTSD